MSDAIREAFEKWWLIEMGHTIHDQRSGDGYFPSDADASWGSWQAALQSSQTAPAVPEGWHDDAQVAIRNAQSDVFRGSREEYYETMMLLFARRILSLNANPQPDHSPDAGKVIQGEPVVGTLMPTETGLYCVRFTVHGGSQANAFIPFCTCHGWAKHQVDIWSPSSEPKSSEWPIANMVGWSGPLTHPA